MKASMLNRLFLIAGVGVILLLAWGKAKEQDEIDKVYVPQRGLKPVFKTKAVPHPTFPHQVVAVGDRKVCVADALVTFKEWENFYYATGYRSWKERNGLSPTWRDGDEAGPVVNLVVEDARAYCGWLNREAGKGLFYLPSAEELGLLGVDEAHWEWTRNTLEDFDEKWRGGVPYFTAWKGKESLRHRRLQDLGHKDVAGTGFRVAWTLAKKASAG